MIPLHLPDAARRESAQLTDFLRFVEARTGVRLAGGPEPAPLHRWTVENDRLFWGLVLEWTGLVVEGSPTPVLQGEDVATARFFPGLRLNYVENLLAGGADDAPAILAVDESGVTARLTRGELRQRVVAAAVALRGCGLGAGDRVVGFVRHTAETIVVALAVTALGGIWSGVSPDLADDAVLSRFAPLEPTFLVAHGETTYQGGVKTLTTRLRTLCAALPTLQGVVALDATVPTDLPAPTVGLESLIATGTAGAAAFTYPRLPFDHPLFVLFSSGTTGAPKCIMHSAGGTLLEHVKEHRLHCDFRPGDKVYFHTTAGWMMWNWLLSALGSRAEIVVYDGAVSYPTADALWTLVAQEKVTVFGTGPTYLQYCRDAGLSPGRTHDLSNLRTLMSTGSILFDTQFDWIVENVKPLAIHSISGGTDLIGCFALGHPLAPVHRGELQSLSLGLDVRSLDGELVCARPFPSRPVGFYGDGDGVLLHHAYYAQNSGYWTHGDFIEITPRGSARILGRSDGVLNIRGTRLGPAELYHILQDVPEVQAALAVAQRWESEPGGWRLVLFVVLGEGLVLDRPLVLRIKKLLSARGSAVHVPAVVAQVAALPTTHSGKRSERAAQDLLDGRPVRNLAALRNPECLPELAAHPALQV